MYLILLVRVYSYVVNVVTEDHYHEKRGIHLRNLIFHLILGTNKNSII